jgi:hypothetical protein
VDYWEFLITQFLSLRQLRPAMPTVVESPFISVLEQNRIELALVFKGEARPHHLIVDTAARTQVRFLGRSQLGRIQERCGDCYSNEYCCFHLFLAQRFIGPHVAFVL